MIINYRCGRCGSPGRTEANECSSEVMDVLNKCAKDLKFLRLVVAGDPKAAKVVEDLRAAVGRATRRGYKSL